MKKILFCFLVPFFAVSQVQIGESIYGPDLNSSNGASLAISENGQIIAMGAPGMHDSNGMTTGAIRIYQKLNNQWTPYGQILFGENEYNRIGSSRTLAMSSDGGIIAFGSPGRSGDFVFDGQVKIMKFINNSWVQLGNNINGKLAYEFLGSSVSISDDGNIVAISGAVPGPFPGGGSDSGFVRVYQNISGVWTQIGLDLSIMEQSDNFGLAIDISSLGNILVVGASNGVDLNAEDTGSVRVYSYSNGNWTQLGQTLYGESSNDGFGLGVSISGNGDVIAVGAPYNNHNGVDSGNVKVFQIDSDEWAQIGQSIPGENLENWSGYSVSLSKDGSVLAIGAPSNDLHGNYNGSTWLEYGNARVYKNNSGTWIQIGNDIDGENGTDNCGNPLQISGDGKTLIVSSVGNHFDGFIHSSGQVRVFDFDFLLSTQNEVLSKINVYPNPTSDFIYVDFQNDLNMNLIQVYDEIGRMILQTNQQKIDLSGVSSGVYYLKIYTNHGIGVKKVIVK